jgi:hypothetical protein
MNFKKKRKIQENSLTEETFKDEEEIEEEIVLNDSEVISIVRSHLVGSSNGSLIFLHSNKKQIK